MKKIYHTGDLKEARIAKQKRLVKHRKNRERKKHNQIKHYESIESNKRSSYPQKEYSKKKQNWSSPKKDMKKKMELWGEERKKVYKDFYRKRKYKGDPYTVTIDGRLGLEEDRDKFLNKAEEIICLESSHLIFDLTNCTRLWPSAVTLLCSYVEWCRLTQNKNQQDSKLGAYRPLDQSVDSYLEDCGFYDYVEAERPSKVTRLYPKGTVVRIERERHKRNVEKKQDEIFDLIKKKSSLSEEELEIFNDRVLPEILNNVLEHGTYTKDYGWFNLVQYHPTTGIISICIADNGMGIKNSLITGPQRESLIKSIAIDDQNDGDAIKKAFEKDVSGAYTASIKDKGIIVKKMARGSTRGNGLDRIKVNCKSLNIPISILSQSGALIFESSGIMLNPINRTSRVFAGTLYHLQIPAKKENTEVN